MACPDTVRTYLASLVPKDQIAFLKYIWFLKLGISTLLVPTQRAHTYCNNRQIVGHEKHQLLASERKGTANFCMGERKGAIIILRTSQACPFRKAEARVCGPFRGCEIGFPRDALQGFPLHTLCRRRVPSPWFVNLALCYHHGNVTQSGELPL